MNLLMLILIALGLWVGVAVCYFAWRIMPDGTRPFTAPGKPSESEPGQAADDD